MGGWGGQDEGQVLEADLGSVGSPTCQLESGGRKGAFCEEWLSANFRQPQNLERRQRRLFSFLGCAGLFMSLSSGESGVERSQKKYKGLGQDVLSWERKMDWEAMVSVCCCLVCRVWDPLEVMLHGCSALSSGVTWAGAEKMPLPKLRHCPGPCHHSCEYNGSPNWKLPMPLC